MKKLNEAIDRFCARHPNLAIPGLMRYIVGANVLFYFLNMLSNGSLHFLALNPAAVLGGEIWRVVTYVLLPDSSGILLLVTCLFYYWLGSALERLWGSCKFTLYFASGTLLTAVGAILVYLIDGVSLSVAGASYVSSAMFLAFAMYNPEAMVYLMYVIPVKMKWVAWFEAGMYAVHVILSAMAGQWGMALMPIIAMLNLFVFLAPEFGRKADRVKAQHRPQAVQFRQAVKEQQKQKGYNHKCCVCGKTDTDYPDMQFRYCSKCAGYHCYCEEHIFNHVHHTE